MLGANRSIKANPSFVAPRLSATSFSSFPTGVQRSISSSSSNSSNHGRRLHPTLPGAAWGDTDIRRFTDYPVRYNTAK